MAASNQESVLENSMDRDYEAEARAEGWVPEEEFKGDKPPDEFVDARTFVERGEKINGVLKSKLSKLENQLESVQKSSEEFRKYSEKQLAKEKEEKASLIKELEERRAKAIDESDGQTFTQLDRQLEQLRSEPEELAPAAKAWLVDNDWYTKNQKLAAFADGIAERIISEGYRDAAYYTELTRRVKESFPDEFQVRRPPTVEGGSKEESSEPGPKSYEALPADAKSACDRFVKDIPGFTKEQYLENYDWD